MEPFFNCIKESKGLLLQTSASGSGASVVAAVTGSVDVTMWGVVVSTAASGSSALVVLGSCSVGGTVCGLCVICAPGTLWMMVSETCRGFDISKEVSGRCCGLRPRLTVVTDLSFVECPGDGVVLSG